MVREYGQSHLPFWSVDEIDPFIQYTVTGDDVGSIARRKQALEVICATMSARPESNPIPTQVVVLKAP
jgi:hypothetical protein